MSEWKTHNRPRPPCQNCGTELYDKFWGNGGWVPTEVGEGERMHTERDCVKVMRSKLADRLAILDGVQRILTSQEGWEERARRALALVTDYLTAPGK